MTVIHNNFGGGSLPPTTSATAPMRANSARVLANRAKAWIDEAMAAREGLSVEARHELAQTHLTTAKECMADDHALAFTSVIGRHAWTARILMAED
jgi:hypothetical protein